MTEIYLKILRRIMLTIPWIKFIKIDDFAGFGTRIISDFVPEFCGILISRRPVQKKIFIFLETRLWGWCCHVEHRQQ